MDPSQENFTLYLLSPYSKVDGGSNHLGFIQSVFSINRRIREMNLFFGSQTAPHTWRAKRDRRKRQTTPD